MQKNKKIILAILFLVVATLLLFLSLHKSISEKTANTVSPYLNSKVEVKTFEGEKGWGYDILIDGTIYVHQPSIPAIPGSDGFKTEVQAKAVAELMIQKIRANILPPGVTAEEVQAIISK